MVVYHCLFSFLPFIIVPITNGLVQNQLNRPALSPKGQRQCKRQSSFCMAVAAHPPRWPPERSPSWYMFDQIDSLCTKLGISIDTLHSHHLDTVYYGTLSAPETEIRPLFVRLRPQSKIHSAEREVSPQAESLVSTPAPALALAPALAPAPFHSQEITRAENAAEATYRWCSNFVKHLNLCPWAKQSLMSENAIRIKVVDQRHGLGAVKRLVRESASELKHYTERGIVDPYIGITFVVSIPPHSEMKSSPSSSGNEENSFDFISFYEFFNDLEETLLDEILDDAGPIMGDDVTVAPFHPEWSFASADETDEDPVNYEKRTPYPTISIVMSEGIDLAGEEMTSRISSHNEEILREMGTDALKKLFNNNVLVDRIE